MRTRTLSIISALLLVFAAYVPAQIVPSPSGGSGVANAMKKGSPLPATCTVGNVFVDTTSSPAMAYVCLTTNVYSQFAAGSMACSATGCVFNSTGTIVWTGFESLLPAVDGFGSNSLALLPSSLNNPVDFWVGDPTNFFSQPGSGAKCIGAANNFAQPELCADAADVTLSMFLGDSQWISTAANDRLNATGNWIVTAGGGNNSITLNGGHVITPGGLKLDVAQTVGISTKATGTACIGDTLAACNKDLGLRALLDASGTGFGTSGFVWTSNGNAAADSWQAQAVEGIGPIGLAPSVPTAANFTGVNATGSITQRSNRAVVVAPTTAISQTQIWVTAAYPATPFTAQACIIRNGAGGSGGPAHADQIWGLGWHNSTTHVFQGLVTNIDYALAVGTSYMILVNCATDGTVGCTNVNAPSVGADAFGFQCYMYTDDGATHCTWGSSADGFTYFEHDAVTCSSGMDGIGPMFSNSGDQNPIGFDFVYWKITGSVLAYTNGIYQAP